MLPANRSRQTSVPHSTHCRTLARLQLCCRPAWTSAAASFSPGFQTGRAHSSSQQQQHLVLGGAWPEASLAELSDSASDGDQEQASCSPSSRHQRHNDMHGTARAPDRGSAIYASAADAHHASSEQHLAGAVRGLHIQGDQAQQQQQSNSGDTSSSQQPQQPTSLRGLLDAGSDVVFEVQPGVSSSHSLPRFGFRCGYRPVGIHLPPPPGQEALALMQHTSGSRSSRAVDAVAAEAGSFAGDAAAASAPLQVSVSSSSWPAGGQTQHSLQQLVAKGQHHVAPARAAPGLRVRSESIISDAVPGGGGSCCDARPRRVSTDGLGPSDPLYHAPASPTEDAGRSCSSRLPGSGRSPAAEPTRASAAGSGRPRSSAFQAAAAPSHAAGRQHDALPSRQSSYSRARTTISRSSVAPSTAGGSSYGGISSGSSSSSSGGIGSSLSQYSQQLSWSGGRSNAMAPGVRKTDRVARFQKMQQAWQKDRYLNTRAACKGRAASISSSGRLAAAVPVPSKPTWED
ncbi:hypothetical protein COO60DRAFT_483852 [Scenedesmus sp. NREL 46B-D3]|nr:hypothetical protein COO60DRAFT_483852 [Scenedesmus sp. NREL 46B-D3]